MDALHDHACEVQSKRHWVDQFYEGVEDVKKRSRSDKEILSVCFWQLVQASAWATLTIKHSSPVVLLSIACSGACATDPPVCQSLIWPSEHLLSKRRTHSQGALADLPTLACETVWLKG
jgi:hypothetical protein